MLAGSKKLHGRCSAICTFVVLSAEQFLTDAWVSRLLPHFLMHSNCITDCHSYCCSFYYFILSLTVFVLKVQWLLKSNFLCKNFKEWCMLTCRKADKKWRPQNLRTLVFLPSPVRRTQLVTANIFHTSHTSPLPYLHANHAHFSDLVEKVMCMQVKKKS